MCTGIVMLEVNVTTVASVWSSWEEAGSVNVRLGGVGTLVNQEIPVLQTHVETMGSAYKITTETPDVTVRMAGLVTNVKTQWSFSVVHLPVRMEVTVLQVDVSALNNGQAAPVNKMLMNVATQTDAKMVEDALTMLGATAVNATKGLQETIVKL